MSRSPNRPAAAARAAVSALAALAWCSSALAIAPPSLSGPPSPGNLDAWTFTYAATPDSGQTLAGYQGGVIAPGDPDPTGALPDGSSTDKDRPEGTWVFRVRALQDDGTGNITASAYSSWPFTIDRTPPSPPTYRFDPEKPNSLGWYRTLTIRWTCTDNLTGATCPDQPMTVAKKGMVASQFAIDGAGNRSATVSTPAFNFDNGAFQPAISSPSNGALVAGEPTYKWTRITDPTSGNNRFEVWARWGGGSYQQIVTAPGSAIQGTRNVRSAPLPEGVTVTWFVRFYDNAGNYRDSAARTFRIDPTPPSAAPVITGGPAGPTRVAAPSFTWTGDQPGFSWAVTRAGDAAPLQSGKGADTHVTLAALADGDYTFSVSQVTGLGAIGPEASQPFTVDTTRPSPPVITARPAAPAAGTAAFAWTTESGATSRWQVIDGSGATVRGPSDALDPAVTLSALATGTYTFRVAQIDAAGNISDPTSESFSIQGAAPVASGGPPRLALPKQNAGRLTPHAGSRIGTLRPVFRWKRGPAGTTVYNLQLFRVVRRQAGTAPSIVKIVSVFPHGLRWKLRTKVRPGQCYVWRVWPFTGSSFTPAPLGISNFCVMSAKALARSKARSRARHATAAARVG